MGRKFMVYKHTTPSNKIYIGITCQKPQKRWRYGYGYSNCPLFYKAIKKYGWDNINHEILYENLTKEEAILKEKELIEKYDSTNNKKGYNLTKGGEGNFGVIFTEDRKQKISKSKMGHKVSEETIKKIKESTSGMKHWNFGRNLSQETKNKISESHKGKKLTPEHIKQLKTFKKGDIPWNKGIAMSEETKTKLMNKSKKKEILCIETNTKFNSIREAYKKTGINYSHIAEVCKGIRKTAGGYCWQYTGGVK